MMYQLDAEGKVSHVNASLSRFLQRSERELVGVHYLNLVHPDQRDRVKSFYEKQLQMQANSSYFELGACLPSGDLIWIGQSVECVYQKGKLQSVFVVVRDISNRIDARNQIDFAEQKYQRVIQNIKLGLLEVDLEERIQSVNRAFCTITGYTEEELLGKKAASVFLDPSDSIQQAQIKRANDSRIDGYSSAYELRIRRKDGKPVYMIISGTPIYDAAGKVVGSLGIHNDISKQKKQEYQRIKLLRKLERQHQRLLESERKYRSIIHSALDAVVSIDDRGRVVEWNAQAEATFGYSEAEAMGRPLSTLIIPDQYAQAHEHGMKNYLKTGRGPVLNKRIEITAIHKSGKVMDVELSISPIQLMNGQMFSAFIRDISAVKKAAADMEQALLQQRELNALRAKLVSMASHEFRTPLTAIRSNLDLMRHKLEASDAQVPLHVDRMDKQLHRLNHILNDILLAGKLDSNSLPFKPKAAYLHKVVESLLNQHYYKHPRILYTFRGSAQVCSIDEELYSHIVTNLVNNALKYSEREIRVEVEYRADSALFLVRDQGIGIPEEDEAKIFDSYFRAKNVGHRSGSGLGLHLSKHIAQRHGAEIGVLSLANQHTTFTVKHAFKDAF